MAATPASPVNSSLKARYQKLFEQAKLCDGAIPILGDEGWWEESCLDKYVEGKKFPDGLKDFASLKLCYCNFYNFYFGPESNFANYGSSLDAAHQIVFPVITGLWKSDENNQLEEPFFPDSEFQKNSFYVLSLANKESPSLPDFQERYTGFSSGRFGDGKATFQNAVKRVLDSWDTSEPITQDVKVFQNMTAMLALTLMQGMVGDEKKLARAFQNREFKKTLHELTKWPYENGYAVPHDKCVSRCCEELRKSCGSVSTMFAMILYYWRSEARLASKIDSAQAIIEAALLNPTKLNGFGTLKLTLAAQRATGLNLEQLKKYSAAGLTETNFADITTFNKKYMEQERPGDTFYWSRLLNDDYMKRMFSPKFNVFFAGAMVAISEEERFFKGASWFKMPFAQCGFNYGKRVLCEINKDKVRS